MSSEFGENCPYVCDFSRIFAILPVFLLFSHGQSVSEQLQLLTIQTILTIFYQLDNCKDNPGEL